MHSALRNVATLIAGSFTLIGVRKPASDPDPISGVTDMNIELKSENIPSYLGMLAAAGVFYLGAQISQATENHNKEEAAHPELRIKLNDVVSQQRFIAMDIKEILEKMEAQEDKSAELLQELVDEIKKSKVNP